MFELKDMQACCKFIKNFIKSIEDVLNDSSNKNKITIQFKLVLWGYLRMVCEKLPFSNSNDQNYSKSDFLLNLSPMENIIVIF